MVGIPFDERRGVIRNRDGRVVDDSGRAIRGLYTTGWIKRGPTGIIGTNRADSVDTVARLIEDLPALDEPKRGRAGLLEILDREALYRRLSRTAVALRIAQERERVAGPTGHRSMTSRARSTEPGAASAMNASPARAPATWAS